MLRQLLCRLTLFEESQALGEIKSTLKTIVCIVSDLVLDDGGVVVMMIVHDQYNISDGDDDNVYLSFVNCANDYIKDIPFR